MTDYVVKKMISELRRLARAIEQTHGTIDGVQNCPYPQGAAAYFKEHGHCCSKCLADEKLKQIELAFGPELWSFRSKPITITGATPNQVSEKP